MKITVLCKLYGQASPRNVTPGDCRLACDVQSLRFAGRTVRLLNAALTSALVCVTVLQYAEVKVFADDSSFAEISRSPAQRLRAVEACP
jgi:hypothetical protein